jgi:ankyrin repeat protein
MDIHDCCRTGNVTELRRLIASGCNLNQCNILFDAERGATPLHTAVENNQLDVVQELLNQGVDPNKAHNWGSTPLHLACINGNLDIVRVLINHHTDGASVSIQNSSGWTPLHWAAFYGHIDIIKELLNHQADPNTITDKGWTPAMCALQYGKLEAFKLLIHRTDLTLKDIRGQCLLDYETNEIVPTCPQMVLDPEVINGFKDIILSCSDIKEPESQ